MRIVQKIEKVAAGKPGGAGDESRASHRVTSTAEFAEIAEQTSLCVLRGLCRDCPSARNAAERAVERGEITEPCQGKRHEKPMIGHERAEPARAEMGILELECDAAALGVIEARHFLLNHRRTEHIVGERIDRAVFVVPRHAASKRR